MKMDINEEGEFVLEEVYNPVHFKTLDGKQFSICQRAGNFNIVVDDVFDCVNMETSAEAKLSVEQLSKTFDVVVYGKKRPVISVHCISK